MKGNFTLTIIITLLFTANLIGQSNYYYHSPQGKEALALSNQKILVKFIAGTNIETQEAILNSQKDIAILRPDMQLPAPKVVVAELQNDLSDTQVWEILHNLNQYPQITYANPVFVHADGTLQAVQESLIVRLKSASDYMLLKNTAASYHLDIIQQNEFDLNTYHLATQKNTKANALAISNELYETGLFEYVEPDFLRFMKKMMTNDPEISSQWSINNTGQYDGIIGADMNIFDAWMHQTGNSNVKVAIIDEGVDINHPDLLANLEIGYDATGQGSAGAHSGNDAHGTACAGIVAAVGNNNLGMAGVAYGSKIIPVRIAYSEGDDWVTSNAWIGNAINWSWQTAGADVLSNSWGGGGSSFTIDAAINNAVTNGRNGLGSPVLFAAGNDNAGVSYPATNENTIAVAAMSMCHERKNPASCDGETWWGSNFGTDVDVAAPGVKIYATDISGSTGYSTGDFITGFNGTSSATPNAAGVMALILSSNENLTEAQARFALESTCEKVGDYTYTVGTSGQPNGSWSNELGYGKINASAAIIAVAPSRVDDAGVMMVDSPNDEAICASQVGSTITLRNNGANNLSSVDINYQIDNSQIHTYQWVGNLTPTQNTQVNLPNIPVSDGVHILNVFTTNPNGQTDTNTSNDHAAATFSSGSNQMTLKIILDNYGTETSWQVKDANGNVLQQGGPYEDNAVGTEIIENICLPADCFDFIIYDAYGDGMCCGYGNGSYQLTDDSNNNTLASGGQYSDQDLTNFCLIGVVNTPLTANITSTNPVSCHGFQDGSATATAEGGVAPYTFNWSNGATGTTATNLEAGTYTLNAIDAEGQIVTISVSINEPTALDLTMTQSEAINGNNGYAAVEVEGGTSSYTYVWSNGASTPGISGLSGGTYTVTVTDANDCFKLGVIVVEEVNTPVLAVTVTSHSNVSCNGDQNGSATATATGGVAPYFYQWNNGQTSNTASGLAAGYAVVAVIDSEGSQTSAQVTITEPAAFALSISTIDADNGDNGSILLNVSGGTLPYTYNWSNGATSANLNNLAAGTYYLTITDNNNCSEVATVVIDDVTLEEPENGLLFEQGVLTDIGENWETISLENNYASMVVIASVRMPNSDAQPVVARVRQAVDNSFEIKIQIPGGTTTDVFEIDYMVIEEGVYNMAEHGVKMEAVKANATKTAYTSSWTREERSYQNEYNQPIVLGQVMTTNNEAWSIFWASSSTSRSVPPSATSFAAGKNVAEDTNRDRANEIIGYLVIESGLGTINDLKFQAGLSDDVVMGLPNSNGEGYACEVEGLLGATSAIVSTAAIDGNNGGWPTLLNEQAVNHRRINLTFDEDQIKDEERSHTTEQAAFIVFEDIDAQPEPLTAIAFEEGIVENVGTQWTNIELSNDYSSMVVVATVVQTSASDTPVVTRIQNTNGNNFQLKVQSTTTSSFINTTYSVHYMVIEEGVYTDLEHGVNMEAVKVNSTQTSARNIWKYEYQTYQNSYETPVILGQVMTYNDNEWSVFWSNNGYRKNPATATSLAIGKHVGEDTDKTRSHETLGYIVMEQGIGYINDVSFVAGLGADIVLGVGGANGTNIQYDIEGATTGNTAILSAAGIDGADCGWPILYGETPVQNGQLSLAYDEDQMSDSERAHTTEQVAYVLFSSFHSNSNFNVMPQAPQQIGSNDTPKTYLAAYPNPTIDVIKIEHEFTSSGAAQIIISDMMGRTILQENIFIEKEAVRHFELDVRHLTVGQYILTVLSDDGPISQQFIKSN